MIISPILFVGLVAGLQVEEWNIDNLEIQDWEVSFPSPFPTPFKDHPRNTEAPTFSAQPTLNPTDAPSLYPTLNPSLQPSSFPSLNPSFAPSIGSPTVDPTLSPTSPPSLCPSFKPSPYPTLFPSLPGHIGSPSPTPYPTSPQQSLELEYILFGTIVTLGDMMVIAATIWSAIVFMLVAFFQRRRIFGAKSPQIVLDADNSTHSDISESSTAHPSSRISQDLPPTRSHETTTATILPSAFISQPSRSTLSVPPNFSASSLPLPDEEDDHFSLRL